MTQQCGPQQHRDLPFSLSLCEGTVWCVVVGGKDDSSGEFIHGHYESNSGDRAVIMGTEHVPNGHPPL